MSEPDQKVKRSAGRPTEKTETVCRVIVDAVRDGVTFRYACELASIHPATGYRWLMMDSDFAIEVSAARAQCIRRLAGKVEDKDPKFLLKVMGRHDYREEIHTVTREFLEGMPKEQLEELVRAILSKRENEAIVEPPKQLEGEVESITDNDSEVQS